MRCDQGLKNYCFLKNQKLKACAGLFVIKTSIQKSSKKGWVPKNCQRNKRIDVLLVLFKKVVQKLLQNMTLIYF